MGLTSALLTGLSGLDVNQTSLNVIGNNIANANTPGFKSGTAIFTPQFYITNAGASAPSAQFGGTDPSQLGLGAQVAAVETNFGAGSIESTGVDTDMAINGDGFFVVQGGGQFYTRDGTFQLNSQNQLVTTSGQFVQGYGVNSSYQIVPGQLQNLVIPLGAASTAQATQNVNLSGNFDAGGPIATGASILNSQSLTTTTGGAPTAATDLVDISDTSAPATAIFQLGQTFTLSPEVGSQELTPQTFTVKAGSTLQDLENFFQTGLQINAAGPAGTNETPGASLVPDPNNPNGVFLTVTGNAGSDNAITLSPSSFVDTNGNSPLTFTAGVDGNGNVSNPVGESINTTAVIYDSLGNPINVNLNVVYEGPSPSGSGTTWSYTATSPGNVSATGNEIVGSGTLTFGTDGTFTGANSSTLNIDRAGTGASSPLAINLNFGSTTALAAQSSNFAVSSQDGSPLGSLSSFSIGSDGTITGSFSNGLTRTLGQVAIATFNNPQGLTNQGTNLYTSSANSGAPIISTPLNLGAGSIQSGSLELSNVDLSTEFTNLIIASTGFSASSKVITTSDQLITDLLNTNR